MSEKEKILEVDNLHVSFHTYAGSFTLLGDGLRDALDPKQRK